MASFTLSPGHPYPDGTVVSAYPDHGEQPGNYQPSGSATSSATVSAGGAATVTGLADGVNYWIVGQVSGAWRWVRAYTQRDVELVPGSLLDQHNADTDDVHGIADTSVLRTAAQEAAAIAAHEADTTSVHGISNTADVLLRTLADAKGDLLGATAADVFARFAVGANGTQLVADSAQSTGLKWLANEVINVKAPPYNATGDGTTDDSTAIQAAIDAVPAAGGTVFFPAGDYLINTGLVLPAMKPIRLLGSGLGMGYESGASRPTRLSRTSGTNTMIYGTGNAFDNRVYVEICDMLLRGGSTAGKAIHIVRGQDVHVNRVKVRDCAATGIHFTQLFNSSLSNIALLNCGSGIASPCLLMDGLNEAQGGCDTVLVTNLQFGGNAGVELKLTGNGGVSGTQTTTTAFSNVKMEGGSGSYPFIDLDHSSFAQFSNVSINNPAARTGVPIVQVGTTNGSRANKFANLTIDAENSGSTYLIQHGRGSMQLANVTLLAAAPTPATAGIRIDSTVGQNDFAITPNVTNNLASGSLISDARTTQAVASAATMILPNHRDVVHITGTADITSVTASWPGRKVTLVFDGTAAGTGLTNGGNLKIGANFVYTPDDAIELACDGTNWYRPAAGAVN